MTLLKDWRRTAIYFLAWMRGHEPEDFQGFRRLVGGRWGRWEVRVRVLGGPFIVWLQSDCEHYPPPPCATSTEPLEVEEYGANRNE